MNQRFERDEQRRNRNIQDVDWLRDDDNFQQDQRIDQQRLGAAYPEDWGARHGGRQSSYGYREEQGAAQLWDPPQRPGPRGWQGHPSGSPYRGGSRAPYPGDDVGEYRGRYYRGPEFGTADTHGQRRPPAARGDERDASTAFASYDGREGAYLEQARSDQGDWGRRDWLHRGSGETMHPQMPGAGPGSLARYRGDLSETGYGSGQMAGRYRGLGPRNYTRSDERITEDLNERLTDDADVDASNLTVRVSDGTATLEGEVEERWMKHRAEDIADSCGGVREVINHIRVSHRRDDADFLGSPGGNAETAGLDPER